MHHIVLWKWKQANFRETYTAEHINRLAEALDKNLSLKHRIICITDDPADVQVECYPIWKDHSDMRNPNGGHLPSCFRRLRLFDPATQAQLGIAKGDRIVSMDIDVLITGNCDEVFSRKDRWVGWAVRGHFHPRVFNGSLWLFTAGDLQHLWTEFDPKVSPPHVLKLGFHGSDQAWLSYKLAREPYAYGWAWPHVASYPREVRVQRVLDRRTRIIFFHGASKPWHEQVQRESPWVHRYWQMKEKVT